MDFRVVEAQSLGEFMRVAEADAQVELRTNRYASRIAPDLQEALETRPSRRYQIQFTDRINKVLDCPTGRVRARRVVTHNIVRRPVGRILCPAARVPTDRDLRSVRELAAWRHSKHF